ncbi:putative uncharacterized protein PKD1L1-AS1 [Pan troglodytes]|uniref:putative uncharacterized protein PKD1L1-AS1 n=1 Tax=Pan troglodytes TaxID=9598 RepID=UPI00301391A2
MPSANRNGADVAVSSRFLSTKRGDQNSSQEKEFCHKVFYWVLVLNSGLLYKFCQTIKCRANWRPARAPRGWNEATERHQERRTQRETEMGGISTTYWHRLCTCTDRRAEKLVMDGNNCWFHK